MKRRVIRVPRLLRLNGEVWKVRFTRDRLMIGKDECRGLADLGAKTIWVDEKQPLRKQRETYAHEVFHASVAKFYGLNPGLEERLALTLEAPLIAFAKSMRDELG